MPVIPRLFLVGLGLFASLPLFADRQTSDLLTGWKFIRQDVDITAPTDKWESVSIPHTWNAVDGRGGLKAHPEFKDGYYRGPAWYARTLDVSPAWKNKRVFIQFEAASLVAQVYLNGKLLGEHRGGFTAFCYELTAGLRFDSPNELRVRVDNSMREDVSPLTGDFNIDGGIYRPVHLIVTDPVCISPLDCGSSGVYLTPKLHLDLPHGPPQDALVEIKAVLSNGTTDSIDEQIDISVKDSAGVIVSSEIFRMPHPLGPGEMKTQPLVADIERPNLWNGSKDPYLYSLTVRISGKGYDDSVTQPLGLRTIAITNEQGFLLNGQPYPIHGVNLHQDFPGKGWAMSNVDHDRDMKLMLEMGVTAIRLAHYPQSEYVHQLADKNGMLLWNEIPMVNAVRDTPGFKADVAQQMKEMILQRYNHPSAAFWGMFNEIGRSMDDISVPVLKDLKREQRELDPTRLNVAASSEFNTGFDTIPDWICYNPYVGWYKESPSDLSAYIDARYQENGNKRIGLSEYGAGADVTQHQEAPVSRPKPFGPFHPEEWQTFFHEQYWARIKNNPKLWGSFIWCMFDFDSSHRNEGGTPGVNDKGLVSADRETKKDAYYFYQANWTDTPMVHINGSRLVERHGERPTIEVYSNGPKVEVFLNGKSLGSMAPDNLHICRWVGFHLQPGANVIEATVPGTSLSDKCTWNYTPSGWNPFH